MDADNPAAERDWNARRAQATVIAALIPQFEHDDIIGETLIFLKPAGRLSRFARYRDRQGHPYRVAERHRCWTLLHPRPGQQQPLVLLDSGLFGYLDPPDGIARPDGLTYLSRNPLRRWTPGDSQTNAPAEDLLRNYLEGALTRYRHFGG
jgi:hypothetical protein